MLYFSHDIFGSQRVGGVSRCMIELMRALEGTDIKWQLMLGDSGNEMIDAERSESWYSRHVVVSDGRRTVTSPLTNELTLRSHIKRGDVVHRTYHPLIDLLPRKALIIETVHDLWDHLHGDSRSPRVQIRRARRRRALHRADAIVCVSQSTREHLVSLWPELESISVVIHHGVRPSSVKYKARCRPRPYFLYVGKRDLYKNFSTVVKALAGSHHLSDFELVCFGGGQLTPAENEIVSAHGLSRRVHVMSGQDDLLHNLYQSAHAFVYPSRHEGFGLPVLEAMAADCPVLTTPCTSIPEVAGSAALYALPDELEAWIHNLENIVQNTDLRSELVKAGRRQAALFSWETSAAAHRQLYKSVMK